MVIDSSYGIKVNDEIQCKSSTIIIKSTNCLKLADIIHQELYHQTYTRQNKALGTKVQASDFNCKIKSSLFLLLEVASSHFKSCLVSMSLWAFFWGLNLIEMNRIENVFVQST